ncbi:MAG: hypothetical protein AB1489_12425 [Acidobacteriota bacterium]
MVEHSSDEILFAGPPTLTRSTAYRLQKVLEQALEGAFTEEQSTLFEAQIVKEWQQGEDSRAALLQVIADFDAICAQIDALPRAKQPLGWREFARQLYKYAQSKGKDEPVGQMILKIYESKRMLLVVGDPPLSRQAAECYIEMNAFFQGVITRSQIALTTEEKDALVNELSRNFADLPDDTKDEISQADVLWGVLRYNWKQASLVEREKFRQELSRIARAYTSTTDQTATETTAMDANAIEAEPSLAPTSVVSEETAAKDTETPLTTSSGFSSKVLAKNQKFIEAVQRLRFGAGKGSPLLPRS